MVVNKRKIQAANIGEFGTILHHFRVLRVVRFHDVFSTSVWKEKLMCTCRPAGKILTLLCVHNQATLRVGNDSKSTYLSDYKAG